MARRRGQRKGCLFQKLTKDGTAGTWYIQYRVDTPDLDPNGKPVRLKVTKPVGPSKGPGKISQREAERIAYDEYLSKVDQASMQPGSMRTLAQLVKERFEIDYLPSLKPTGRSFYRNMLDNHILPTMGPVKLRDIDVPRVQALLNAERTKGLSTQTVVHVRNCLSAVLRHAKAMQWFSGELPTESVRLPEMRRKERRALSWPQVCQLSSALTEPIATLTPFLALTGLRIGEAMGLRWKYVNLTEEPRIVGTEVIPAMCVAVRENYVRGRYQSLKTSKSSRNVPIPEWFAPRLLTLGHTSGNWNNPEDPLFPSKNGTPLDQHNCAKRFLKPAAKALDMPWVSWHSLRHSNATMADQAGFTMTERMRILGHSTERMANHYAHSDLEKMRERLAAMADPKLLQ